MSAQTLIRTPAIDRRSACELACVQADDNTGPSLWMRIVKILET
jgi:hypothetical protein